MGGQEALDTTKADIVKSAKRRRLANTATAMIAIKLDSFAQRKMESGAFWTTSLLATMHTLMTFKQSVNVSVMVHQCQHHCIDHHGQLHLLSQKNGSWGQFRQMTGLTNPKALGG